MLLETTNSSANAAPPSARGLPARGQPASRNDQPANDAPRATQAATNQTDDAPNTDNDRPTQSASDDANTANDVKNARDVDENAESGDEPAASADAASDTAGAGADDSNTPASPVITIAVSFVDQASIAAQPAPNQLATVNADVSPTAGAASSPTAAPALAVIPDTSSTNTTRSESDGNAKIPVGIAASNADAQTTPSQTQTNQASQPPGITAAPNISAVETVTAHSSEPDSSDADAANINTPANQAKKFSTADQAKPGYANIPLASVKQSASASPEALSSEKESSVPAASVMATTDKQATKAASSAVNSPVTGAQPETVEHKGADAAKTELHGNDAVTLAGANNQPANQSGKNSNPKSGNETTSATVHHLAAEPKPQPSANTDTGNPVAELTNTSSASQNTPAITPPLSAPQIITPTTLPNANSAVAAAVPLSALPVEIAARARDGKNRFEIRLDPPELGRIDVRLDIDRSGQVISRLTVERPETLDLLRRDAHQIERALQDAGLKTSDQGLQFSLRDQSFAGQNDDAPPTVRLELPQDESIPLAAIRQGYGQLLGLGGGVDIRV